MSIVQMESFLCKIWLHYTCFFLIPGRCDRFPGQKTPVPGRKNRFPDFWIWSAISSGFWRFSPGTGRFPVPGLKRENTSRRKHKPCSPLPLLHQPRRRVGLSCRTVATRCRGAAQLYHHRPHTAHHPTQPNQGPVWFALAQIAQKLWPIIRGAK